MKNFYEEDVAILMQGITLHHNTGVLGKLRGELSWANEYAYLLRHYAYARFEPLTFIYKFRRLLDACSPALVEDLLTSEHLHFQTLGLWMACLVDMRVLRTEIESTAVTDRLRLELKLLALGLAGDTVPAKLVPAEELLRGLRTTLSSLTPGVFPLRPALDDQLLQTYLEQAARVKAAYRTGGFDLAKPLLSQPLLRYYQQPHAKWVTSGALPPPRR